MSFTSVTTIIIYFQEYKMTPYQISQYQKRYTLDDYVCQSCGHFACQIAHRIAKTKTNYNVYGNEIIDHNFNLVSVCSLKCNDSFNIGNKPGTSQKLVNLIRSNNEKLLTSQYINNILNK